MCCDISPRRPSSGGRWVLMTPDRIYDLVLRVCALADIIELCSAMPCGPTLRLQCGSSPFKNTCCCLQWFSLSALLAVVLPPLHRGGFSIEPARASLVLAWLAPVLKPAKASLGSIPHLNVLASIPFLACSSLAKDYTQLELRIAAHLTDCPAMINMLAGAARHPCRSGLLVPRRSPPPPKGRGRLTPDCCRKCREWVHFSRLQLWHQRPSGVFARAAPQAHGFGGT